MVIKRDRGMSGVSVFNKGFDYGEWERYDVCFCDVPEDI